MDKGTIYSEMIQAYGEDIVPAGGKSVRIPEYWDSNDARRIVAYIEKIYL